MIRAVIFDMDGVLIDSEPFWQESEMEAFGRLGLSLTREMCLQTMGLRVDEVVEYWRRRQTFGEAPAGRASAPRAARAVRPTRTKASPASVVAAA